MQNMLNVQHLNRQLARRRLLRGARAALGVVAGMALVAIAWILLCLILGIGLGILLVGCRTTIQVL